MFADPDGGAAAAATRGMSEPEWLAKAFGIAAAHIGRRERTVAEVEAHLERKGIPATTAAAVVAELVETQALDDARFAGLFVVDKRGLEQWGVERIRRGLRERGIDRDLAEHALATESAAEGTGPEGELDRACALLRRRFPEPPQNRRDRDRALGMLVRKGYASELALDAITAHARGE